MLDALVVVNATRSAFDILDVLLTRHIVSLRSGCFVTAIVQGRRVIPSTSCFAYRYRRKPCSWTFVFAPVSCSSTVHAATRRYTTHDADDAGGRQPPSLSLSLSRARAIAPPGDDARAHPPIISHHHHQSPSSRARSARYFKRGCFVPPRRRARHTHTYAQTVRARPRRVHVDLRRFARAHPHPSSPLETTHATNHDHDGCGRPIKRRRNRISIPRAHGRD